MKSYGEQRGFGYVAADDGSDLFFHVASRRPVFVDSGKVRFAATNRPVKGQDGSISQPMKGARVVFIVAPGREGTPTDAAKVWCYESEWVSAEQTLASQAPTYEARLIVSLDLLGAGERMFNYEPKVLFTGTLEALRREFPPARSGDPLAFRSTDERISARVCFRMKKQGGSEWEDVSDPRIARLAPKSSALTTPVPAAKAVVSEQLRRQADCITPLAS